MILGKKKVRIIGLDVGSRTLKVAELADSKDGYTLKKFGMSDIEPGFIEDGVIKNPEGVADAIRKLLKMFKIKDINIALSIGGYSIIVKTITCRRCRKPNFTNRSMWRQRPISPLISAT